MVDRIHTARGCLLPSKRIRQVLLMVTVIPELLFLFSAGLLAQRSPFDPAWTGEAAIIREEVSGFTDRSLYLSEELIGFRATVSFTGPALTGPWSTVLYVELVSADGRSLTQGKYPISNMMSHGKIKIPDDLLSGHYYLRFYTRWMRNRGPESFCYLPLRIINPKRTELDRVSSSENAQPLVPVRMDSGKSLEFREHVSACERGDSIYLQLIYSGGQLTDSLEGCLSVVPLALVPSSSQYSVRGAGQEFSVNFLPDRYGPSLSGSVLYPGGPVEALPPAVIHLTLMSDVSGYLVCRSDSLGKFTVGLPNRSGKLEIFVLPESPGESEVEVRIDQDFDPRHIHFPPSPFILTDIERMWAEIMARNVQLSELFGPSDTLPDRKSDRIPRAFYGTPTRSVDLDQYVLLPTLREVFVNLVPDVSPVTRKGSTTLQIESENPSFSLFESLVMVDQVPVLDMEQFMSLSPAKIKQIDVIEDVYVRGDLRYGGVINLISRNGDMAGIDLPGNSFFIDYTALQAAEQSNLSPANAEDQIPDMRNTFLWLPDFVVQKDAFHNISFIAPDYPGEYVIIFRGVNDQGRIIRAETTFTVR